MRQHALTVGLHLLFKGAKHKIIAKSEFKVTLEKLDDLSLFRVEERELLNALTQNELTIYGKEISASTAAIDDIDFSSLSCLPQAQKDEVFLRFKFVKQAINMLGNFPKTTGLDNVIETVLATSPNMTKPSKYSLFRWWKRYANYGNDILCLASRKSGKAGRSGFSVEVNDALFEIIEDEYLIETRPPVAYVYKLFENRMDCMNANRPEPYKFPSRAQFYRLVGQLDQYSVMKARFGKQKADKLFRAVGKGPVTTRILERVEVDHTKLDVFVVDEETGEVIGRPTITVIIDCFSRMVLGIYIGFEPPSLIAVMRALKQAILPKDMTSALFGNVAKDWPAYGIPMRLICDNGNEFHANTFLAMCAELGIDLQFCPRRKGEYKGTVERFNGRINREICHIMPGTSFESIDKREDYDPQKHASATESELTSLIYRWLIDVYSHEINRGTQHTPYDLWNKGLQQISPVLPESETALSFCMTDEYERTLSFKGIEIFNMFYQSSALKEMRHAKSSSFTVTVRGDAEDISHIWVLDTTTNKYVKVPSTEPEYAKGLSLRQHRRIRKLVKQSGQESYDGKAVRAHRAELNSDIKNLKSANKIRQSERAAQNSQKNQSTLNDLTKSAAKQAPNSEELPEQLDLETFESEEL